jgi:DNA-binding NarL/FixJ family response regulator
LIAAAPSLLRQGLVATLREQWPLLQFTLTADVTQLAKLVQEAAFALLVLDGKLPGQALPSLLAQLYRVQPMQRVVVLTDRRSPSGLGTWSGKPLQLPRHVLPHTLVAALSQWLDAPSPQPVPARLVRECLMLDPFSPRELEVLRLVVADHCNEEIANQLSLSVRTVESHRRTLLHKAGTRTLVGLAARAVREGWVA